MRLQSAQVFDDIIVGTATTWYSSAQFNSLLRVADCFAIQACTTGVTGTATLTVQAEHSADNQNWFPTPSAEISTAIANEGSYLGSRNGQAPVLMSFVRFRVTLTGTSPQCRLRLYVTGRARSGQAAG